MASKLILHTDRIPKEYQTQVDQLLNKIVPADVEVAYYNHSIGFSWRSVHPALPPEQTDKYERCVTLDDIKAINANYKKDLVGDKVWSYPLTDAVNVYELFRYDSNLKGFQSYLPNAKNVGSLVQMTSIEELNLDLPKATEVGNLAWGCKLLKRAKLNAPLAKYIAGTFQNCPELESFEGYLPLVTNNGIGGGCNIFDQCSSLRRCSVDLPSLSNGAAMFSKCILDKESVLRILNSIPSYTSGTHKLTLGIHVDHQSDDEVLAAIANAESKGWSLTVQWNGTPTASTSVTYGLRKPPIFAKVSEMERPDCTPERVLDWGHYVTDPSGYEEFRSIEEAREYFGLPIED